MNLFPILHFYHLNLGLQHFSKRFFQLPVSARITFLKYQSDHIESILLHNCALTQHTSLSSAPSTLKPSPFYTGPIKPLLLGDNCSYHYTLMRKISVPTSFYLPFKTFLVYPNNIRHLILRFLQLFIPTYILLFFTHGVIVCY